MMDPLTYYGLVHDTTRTSALPQPWQAGYAYGSCRHCKTPVHLDDQLSAYVHADSGLIACRLLDSEEWELEDALRHAPPRQTGER